MFYHYADEGEYLYVDHRSAGYYQAIGKPELRECRAPAIAGQASSVCTTSVDVTYLREHCKRVPRSAVPVEWLRVLTGEK